MNIVFLEIDDVLNSANCTSFAPDNTVGVQREKILELRRATIEAHSYIVICSKRWTQHLIDNDKNGQYLEKKFNRYGLHILDKCNSPQEYLVERPWIKTYCLITSDYGNTFGLPNESVFKTTNGLNCDIMNPCIDYLLKKEGEEQYV